jgi:hypothetical protein
VKERRTPLWTRREFLVRSALAAGAVYSVALEPNLPRVERVSVPIPGLPTAFDGFTILQLCDIHLGPHVTEGKMRHGYEIAARPPTTCSRSSAITSREFRKTPSL